MTQQRETSGREVSWKDGSARRKQKAVGIVKQQVASTTKDVIFKITELRRELARVVRFFLFGTAVSPSL